MKTTKQSVKLNKLNYLIRIIKSSLNNGDIKSAIVGVKDAGLTPEQFGYISRVHENITDEQLSTFIHYVVNYQLVSKTK